MNNQLKLIKKHPFFEVYQVFIEGKPVRLIRNLSDGRVCISSNDIAKALGYQDIKQMMTDPDVQKVMYSSDFQKVLKELRIELEDLFKYLKPEDLIPQN